jgi:beta-xylosidase
VKLIKAGIFLLVGIALLGYAEPRSATATTPAVVDDYRNPLGVDVADPHVIRHQDTYYLYGTSSRHGYKVWTSKDLAHWDERGFAFEKTLAGWGRAKFWAPCVLEKGGSFYMFYSALGEVAGGRASLRICLAKSDSPLGPFRDVKAPLFDLGKAVIDANVFIDTDGKPYLYYALDHSEQGFSSIWVAPLKDDLQGLAGEPKFCMKPDQAWETQPWNEGPFVIKSGDGYVMTYSANGFFDPAYGIGYATSKSPMGPWTKARENPILSRNTKVSGPGHNSIIASPDGSELFIVYHVQKSLAGGDDRELAIDRMFIDQTAGGPIRVRVTGVMSQPQPLPAGASLETSP